uniref:Immunoglobulin V-set domain-containing protein n=1 Tax=Phlebotomus papatasi TaxID=29031 RepID=A0A1B0DH97_PHLPP
MTRKFFDEDGHQVKDFQLLTVGLLTYSSDDRFQVEHTRHLGNWALRIKGCRKEDEGHYECQISTHPPQSIFVELRIVGLFQ